MGRRPNFIHSLALVCLALTVVFSALGKAEQARADGGSFWWSPDCANSDNTDLMRATRCLGGANLRTRGWFLRNPECLWEEPIPGQIYPYPQYCGGVGFGGEQLSQARVIAHLGAQGPDSVSPDVQWEVGLYQANPAPGDTPGNRFADVTYYDHTDPMSQVQVYELKRTDNPDFGGRRAQMLEYTALLDDITRAGAIPGDALTGWVDVFGVDRGIPCGPDDSLDLIQVFIAWQEADGLFDIYPYNPPCFDPATEPIPQPAEEPADVNFPANLPSYLFEPHFFPGTYYPAGGHYTPPGYIPPPQPTPDPWPGKNPVQNPPGSGGGGGGDQTYPWYCGFEPSCIHWPNFSFIGHELGRMFGEPHLITLDGLHYDFQTVGEFEAVAADQYGMDVQARLVPAQTAPVSVIDAVAFSLAGHAIEIGYNGANPYLYIDHSAYTLSAGSMLDFDEGAYLVRTVDGFAVAWPGDGLRPVLWYSRDQFAVYVPPNTNVRGLLGNANGDPSDDLMTAFGTVLPGSADPATIEGTYADSWRITQDHSLFTYGEGDSTATYTDRSFPDSTLTLGDLSDSVLADATSHCVDAGVADNALFDDCVLDWAVTQDSAFVDAASVQTTPMLQPGARTVDSSGIVTENFDGDVAPNFSSARYGAGPGTGTSAGPFGYNGRYVFYVPAIPSHDSATIQFDLVAIGDWTTDAQDNTVALSVDGTNVWTGAVATGTPTSTGTLTSGQPYAVYPVSLTVPHSATQLNAGISAAIPAGSNRAFSVDNVSVSVDVVAPQSFDIALPASISNGSPATGAGDLETAGSQDDYHFSAAGGTLQIDMSDCDASLGYYVTWRLFDDDTNDLVQSWSGCEGRRVPGLAAGNYRLEVTHPGVTGSYSLSVYSAPSPQAFDVTLPASISDGSPASGAGNLETTSSTDSYDFSTTVLGGVQVDFSSCSSSLGYNLDWKIVSVGTSAPLYATSGCGSTLVPNLPPGDYELVVSRNGLSGTYDVALSLAATPEYFNVSLPVNVSDGVPAAGAGNLETTSSEDNYLFATSSTAGLQVDVSGCGSSLGYNVDWQLIDEQTHDVIYSTTGCDSHLVPNVSAGQYRLAVSRTGSTGTYTLGLLTQPSPQTFAVTLPASIADGLPTAGAGNLETTASEDDYRFTTSTSNDIHVDFSSCSGSLGYNVDWKLVNDQSGASLYSTSGCGSSTVTGVGAGTYRVAVTRNGRSGTYHLALSVVLAPDVFNVTLPVSVSNGAPSFGAGNLETTSSEDDYVFTTTAAGAVQFDFANCSSSLGYYVTWKLLDSSGSILYSTSDCVSKLITGLAAGQYKLVVTRTGASGTYAVGILVQPPAQVFNVTLPATISNGSPAAGAGNLETTASEDDYAFTTATTGTLRLAFSGCGSSLGFYLNWKLINVQSGATVYSASACSTSSVTSLPAGQYRVIVTRNGKSGTYQLGISLS